MLALGFMLSNPAKAESANEIWPEDIWESTNKAYHAKLRTEAEKEGCLEEENQKAADQCGLKAGDTAMEKTIADLKKQDKKLMKKLLTHIRRNSICFNIRNSAFGPNSRYGQCKSEQIRTFFATGRVIQHRKTGRFGGFAAEGGNIEMQNPPRQERPILPPRVHRPIKQQETQPFAQPPLH